MRNSLKHKYIITFVVICFFTTNITNAWGFWGHMRINRLAVFTLPPEMIGFYKKHIEFLTEHAVDPDKRRYASEDEAARHYIDIDHYDSIPPYKALPRFWKDAVAKYTEDTLKAYGIVPWHTEVMLGRLTYAFKERNVRKIIQTSADLGHYIADGHVPLHATENYNGLKTNQKGIHGFWESRIPELYGDNFDFWVGKAEFIKNPNKRIWQYIVESGMAVDSVLSFERILNSEYDTDKKYCFEQRGATTMQVYCEGYTKNYMNMLDGMVERRMRSSILDVGSFWYTAWVNAGQPNLDNLNYIITDKDLEEEKELEDSFNKGKIKGREHQD